MQDEASSPFEPVAFLSNFLWGAIVENRPPLCSPHMCVQTRNMMKNRFRATDLNEQTVVDAFR